MTEPGELNRPLLQAADDSPPPPPTPPQPAVPETPTQPTAAPAPQLYGTSAEPARSAPPATRPPPRIRRRRRPARPRPPAARAARSVAAALASRDGHRRRHRDGARRRRVARQCEPRRILVLERHELRQRRTVLRQPVRPTHRRSTVRNDSANVSGVTGKVQPGLVNITTTLVRRSRARAPVPGW